MPKGNRSLVNSNISEYNREQLEAVRTVGSFLRRLLPAELSHLKRRTAHYIGFRRHVDEFLLRHFSQVCTLKCYQDNYSACCNREGITTFFADVVINLLVSSDKGVDKLLRSLCVPKQGMKCVYLEKSGCLWRIKPIVCEIFLCEHATQAVFGTHPEALEEWKKIRRREKRYTWPTRRVLFDDLETYFIGKGCSCSLMYFHNSPGLLRVKALAAKQGKTKRG